MLCLDKDRKPLRDIILWLDQRKADSTGKIPPAKAALFRLVGMGEAVKILFRATAANWLMQNEPELWEQTDKYVMLPTYLNYKLTGELKDAASDMIGHVPFDYKGRCWMGTGELTRCVCDVPQEKLCELVPSGAVIGNITEDAAAATGIPVGLPLNARSVCDPPRAGCRILRYHRNAANGGEGLFRTPAVHARVSGRTERYL